MSLKRLLNQENNLIGLARCKDNPVCRVENADRVRERLPGDQAGGCCGYEVLPVVTREAMCTRREDPVSSPACGDLTRPVGGKGGCTRRPGWLTAESDVTIPAVASGCALFLSNKRSVSQVAVPDPRPRPRR